MCLLSPRFFSSVFSPLSGGFGFDGWYFFIYFFIVLSFGLSFFIVLLFYCDFGDCFGSPSFRSSRSLDSDFLFSVFQVLSENIFDHVSNQVRRLYIPLLINTSKPVIQGEIKMVLHIRVQQSPKLEQAFGRNITHSGCYLVNGIEVNYGGKFK